MASVFQIRVASDGGSKCYVDVDYATQDLADKMASMLSVFAPLGTDARKFLRVVQVDGVSAARLSAAVSE